MKNSVTKKRRTLSNRKRKARGDGCPHCTGRGNYLPELSGSRRVCIEIIQNNRPIERKAPSGTEGRMGTHSLNVTRATRDASNLERWQCTGSRGAAHRHILTEGGASMDPSSSCELPAVPSFTPLKNLHAIDALRPFTSLHHDRCPLAHGNSPRRPHGSATVQEDVTATSHPELGESLSSQPSELRAPINLAFHDPFPRDLFDFGPV